MRVEATVPPPLYAQAEDLIEKTKKLNQDLESKQLHLQELQEGIAAEQRYTCVLWLQ